MPWETWVRIAESLLPVTVLVALGVALEYTGFHGEAVRKGMDRLVYWVCLPALIVAKVAESGGLSGEVWRIAAVLALATLSVAALAWAIGQFARFDHEGIGVVTQSALRGNLAFVGLPVILLASGEPRTEQLGALVLAPLVLLYNILSVAALVVPQHLADRTNPPRDPATTTADGPDTPDAAASPNVAALAPRIARSMVTNPLLIACLIGLVIAAIGRPLPSVVSTSVSLLGKPAATLALISLGGALVVYRIRGNLTRAAVAGVLKLVAVPAITWLGCGWMGLDGEATLVAMIFASCPTAVASYVLVTQLGGDRGLAASCVALTTLGSLISLAVAIAIAG